MVGYRNSIAKRTRRRNVKNWLVCWTSFWTVALCCLRAIGNGRNYYRCGSWKRRVNRSRDGKRAPPPKKVCSQTRDFHVTVRGRRKLKRTFAVATTFSTPSDKNDDNKDDPLRRTKKPWGGLIKDIERRLPYYKSDFSQGLNLQCIASAIFIYFAALSAAITFGGLMGKGRAAVRDYVYRRVYVSMPPIDNVLTFLPYHFFSG